MDASLTTTGHRAMPGVACGAADGAATAHPEGNIEADSASTRWGRAQWVFVAVFFALRGAGIKDELPEEVLGFVHL